MPRRVITPLAFALVLSGCAVEQHEIAESGRSVLVGMSDTDIRMCAGHPNNEDKIKGGEIWMYEHGATSLGGVSVAPVLPVLPFGGATIGEAGNGYCRVHAPHGEWSGHGSVIRRRDQRTRRDRRRLRADRAQLP